MQMKKEVGNLYYFILILEKFTPCPGWILSGPLTSTYVPGRPEISIMRNNCIN